MIIISNRSIKTFVFIINTIGTVDDLIEKKEEEFKSKIRLLSLLFDKYETDKNVSFGEAFITFNGGTFQSKFYVPYSENKLITIKNVDDSGFNTDSVSYISNDKADKRILEATILPPQETFFFSSV